MKDPLKGGAGDDQIGYVNRERTSLPIDIVFLSHF